MWHGIGVSFFADMKDEQPAIRPFTNVSEALRYASVRLREFGGCPIMREAKTRKHPFRYGSIDKSNYPGFLERRFFQEFEKLQYADVAVVPIVIGRGLTTFTIGLKDKQFAGELRNDLISLVCVYSTCLISRYPELIGRFKSTTLNNTEAKILLFCSNGNSLDEIGELLGLSELSIRMILDNAVKKLGTTSRAQAIAKSMAMGELSNLQIGEYDII